MYFAPILPPSDLWYTTLARTSICMAKIKVFDFKGLKSASVPVTSVTVSTIGIHIHISCTIYW